MAKKRILKEYTRTEEAFNIYSHGAGIIMAVIATVLMIDKTWGSGLLRLVNGLVFGLSMIILYTSSTVYHATRKPRRRMIMNIVDHAAIYVLIAGTYTPFTLITLKGTMGTVLFIIAWSIALVGILLKTKFTGRFDVLSTILYVAMGWMVVVAIIPLFRALPTTGLWWLFGGGLSYTLGAVIYSIDRINYNHAIFHVFVLGGSFAHIICIYHYVI